MTDPDRAPTAAVIVIGNEVLSGRTRDSNLHYLAGALTELGIRLREARVVADDQPAIIAAVHACRAAYDHVFTTGGIGPTHDDITAEAMAAAFGVPLLQNPEAVARLRRNFADPADLNAARLRMARIPEGAELIDNPVSNAPGFRLGNVYVLAGVPRIAQAMFESLRPTLTGGPRVWSTTLTVWAGEGLLAAGMAEVQATHGDVEIGSYPFFRDGRPGVAMVVRGTDRAALARAAAALRAMAEPLSDRPVDEDTP